MPTSSYPTSALLASVVAIAVIDSCTILLVTHDNRILDIADRIVSMEDGRLLN